MHTVIVNDGIKQVLWLGRRDSESTWVSALSLPSSIISLRKAFKQQALSKKTATMSRKPLPLALQKKNMHISDIKRMRRSRPVVEETSVYTILQLASPDWYYSHYMHCIYNGSDSALVEDSLATLSCNTEKDRMNRLNFRTAGMALAV